MSTTDSGEVDTQRTTKELESHWKVAKFNIQKKKKIMTWLLMRNMVYGHPREPSVSLTPNKKALHSPASCGAWMSHSSQAASLLMDFLVPIILATNQRFILWLTLTDTMWCQSILSPHKDWSCFSLRWKKTGCRMTKQHWMCHCEFKRDGKDSPPRGQPISKCRWWEITESPGVKLNTCYSTGDSRISSILRSQQLCKGPRSTTSGQSQSAIIVLEFIKGLMEHNYLGKLTHACSFQAVFFLC